MRGKESPRGPGVKRQADPHRNSRASAWIAKGFADTLISPPVAGFTLSSPAWKPSLAPTNHESVMESGASPEQSRCGDRLRIPSVQSFPNKR